MKKWKVIRNVTVSLLVLFVIYLIIDVICCINMEYPHPMLGIDAHNWGDQFRTDLLFILYLFGIPLIIDIVLLVISIVKLKNKNEKNASRCNYSQSRK